MQSASTVIQHHIAFQHNHSDVDKGAYVHMVTSSRAVMQRRWSLFRTTRFEFTSYFRRIYFNIILSSTHVFGSLFPLGLRINILWSFLISPMRTICPAHFIRLNMIILIIIGEDYGPSYYSVFSSLGNQTPVFLVRGSLRTPEISFVFVVTKIKHYYF